MFAVTNELGERNNDSVCSRWTDVLSNIFSKTCIHPFIVSFMTAGAAAGKLLPSSSPFRQRSLPGCLAVALSSDSPPARGGPDSANSKTQHLISAFVRREISGWQDVPPAGRPFRMALLFRKPSLINDYGKDNDHGSNELRRTKRCERYRCVELRAVLFDKNRCVAFRLDRPLRRQPVQLAFRGMPSFLRRGAAPRNASTADPMFRQMDLFTRSNSIEWHPQMAKGATNPPTRQSFSRTGGGLDNQRSRGQSQWCISLYVSASHRRRTPRASDRATDRLGAALR